MTKCLILSHAFNMDGRAASQTITDKIPHLIERGFSLYVLSAVTGYQDRNIFHKQLVSWGPSAFRFDFRHWFAIRFGRGGVYKVITSIVSVLLTPLIFAEKILVGLSSQWSWSLPAILYGFILIKRENIDVIYSTGGAWSAHFAGLMLKLLTGCVWLVEIHDPLVVRVNCNGSIVVDKSTRDKKFQIWLETKISESADLVWWFTRSAFDFAIKRNPILEKKGFFILPGSARPPIEVKHEFQKHFHIGHFGSLSQSRSLSQLLIALPKFFIRRPSAQHLLRINIFGSELDAISKRCIKKLGLEFNVVLHGRVEGDDVLSGREKILSSMQQSDVLLLLHGNYEGCSEYIPSKLYEYWWSRRPILGLIFNNPELNTIINSINGRSSLVADIANTENIVVALCAAWDDWRLKKKFALSADPLDVSVGVNEIFQKYKILDKLAR